MSIFPACCLLCKYILKMWWHELEFIVWQIRLFEGIYCKIAPNQIQIDFSLSLKASTGYIKREYFYMFGNTMDKAYLEASISISYICDVNQTISVLLSICDPDFKPLFELADLLIALHSLCERLWPNMFTSCVLIKKPSSET